MQQISAIQRAFVLMIVGQLVSTVGLLNAQTPGGNSRSSAAAIVFLQYTLQTANSGNAPELAQEIGLSESDINIVVDAARSFSVAQSQLRDEARAYTNGQRRSRNALDADKIRSFASRRDELSQAALASLRTRLSTDSYAVLSEYLRTVENSIVIWRGQ
jgi:hypothetical protein